MPEEADLKLDGLAVRYGHVAAVNGISLSVRHGSIVAVLGANGAGKTSTLNALAGISPGKVSGTITLFGRRSPSRPHRVVKSGHGACSRRAPGLLAADGGRQPADGRLFPARPTQHREDDG